jgi:predicted DNA-binding transcriptional regulator AlpA
VRLGTGPKSPVVYRRSDVEEWLADHTYQSTAEEHTA